MIYYVLVVLPYMCICIFIG